MKIHTLLGVGVGIGLGLGASTLASADASTNAMGQGGQDAALAFCLQVNPAGASAYKSLASSLRDERSKEGLGALRHPAYQRAYAEVFGALNAARPDWALGACVELASKAASGGGSH